MPTVGSIFAFLVLLIFAAACGNSEADHQRGLVLIDELVECEPGVWDKSLLIERLNEEGYKGLEWHEEMLEVCKTYGPANELTPEKLSMDFAFCAWYEPAMQQYWTEEMVDLSGPLAFAELIEAAILSDSTQETFNDTVEALAICEQLAETG